MSNDARSEESGPSLAVIKNETDTAVSIPVKIVSKATVGEDRLEIPASDSVAIDQETTELLENNSATKALLEEGRLRLDPIRPSTSSKAGDRVRSLLNLSEEPQRFLLKNETDQPITLPYPIFSTTTVEESLPVPAADAIVVDKALLAHADYEDLVENDQIRIVDASESPDALHFKVANKTARRIGIQSISTGDNDELVIPAFGSRRVTPATLATYDFRSWTQRNLISVEEETPSTEPPSGEWILFTSFVIYGGIATAIFADQVSIPILGSLWGLYLIIAALLLIASIINWKKAGARIKQALVQNLNLLLLLLIGPIGLPLIVLFLFGDIDLGTLDVQDPIRTQLLVRSIQGVLIILLSALPGMLYFQFERRQVQTLRTRFIREIMLLNPEIHTVDDAEIAYGNMVDEVSGSVGASSKQFALLTAGRPVLAATVLITVGWIVTLWPVGTLDAGTSIHALLTPQPTAISFAFLGAYFFALNMIFRRYTRGDLTPKAYSNVAVRILSAIIVVWVLSAFFNRTSSPPEAGLEAPSSTLLAAADTLSESAHTLAVLGDTLIHRADRLSGTPDADSLPPTIQRLSATGTSLAATATVLSATASRLYAAINTLSATSRHFSAASDTLATHAAALKPAVDRLAAQVASSGSGDSAHAASLESLASLLHDRTATLDTLSATARQLAAGASSEDEDYFLLLVLAFGVGIIPETGLALIKDLMRKQRLGKWFPSLSVKHPITELEGVSLYDRVRLLEEGVESVENLAHHNLIELMLRSGVPTSRLVDLIDQAILYLHVTGVVEGTANSDETGRGIHILRQCGIRTATDLLRVTARAEDRVKTAKRGTKTKAKADRDQLFALLDPAPTSGPHRLQLVLDAMEDDEWLEYVKNWRSLHRSKEIVDSPDQFYHLHSE